MSRSVAGPILGIMPSLRTVNLVCLIAALVATSVEAAPVAQNRLYRYTNADGVIVIDDRVPIEHAGQGYEVITEKGEVLEVIPRALTEAERQAQAEVLREQQKAAEAAERSRDRDKNLLLRYSTIEDIQAAKERSLSELEIRVGILKSNRIGLKAKLDSLQSQAADIERRGGEVGLDQLKAMDDLRIELQSTEQSIVSRQDEISRVASEYDDDMERFAELLEIVKAHRDEAQQESS